MQEGTAYVEQRIAAQFDQLSAICPSLAFKSCKGADRTNWTDAGRTRPCCYLLGAPGRWSFLKLQTFTGSGRQLVQGGDSWVVELRHNESGVRLPSRVFDEGDGSYLVAFLPRLAGEGGQGGQSRGCSGQGSRVQAGSRMLAPVAAAERVGY